MQSEMWELLKFDGLCADGLDDHNSPTEEILPAPLSEADGLADDSVEQRSVTSARRLLTDLVPEDEKDLDEESVAVWCTIWEGNSK